MACLDEQLFTKNPFLDLGRCSICTNIIQTTAEISCPNGHVFGDSCVKKWFEKNQTCPICQQICKDKNVKSCFKTNSMISLLEHKCENKDCDWKNTNGLYQLHLKECQYQKIKCIMCNNIEVIRKDMSNHEKECPNRPQKCKYCNNTFLFAAIANHESWCDEKIIQCNECKISIKCKDIYHHRINECPEAKVHCKYSKYDCKDLVARKDLDAHYKEKVAEHLNCIEKNVKKHYQTIEIPSLEIFIGKHSYDNFIIDNVYFKLIAKDGIFLQLNDRGCFKIILNIEKVLVVKHSRKNPIQWEFNVNNHVMMPDDQVGKIVPGLKLEMGTRKHLILTNIKMDVMYY
jgi:hypothetical protein